MTSILEKKTQKFNDVKLKIFDGSYRSKYTNNDHLLFNVHRTDCFWWTKDNLLSSFWMFSQLFDALIG